VDIAAHLLVGMVVDRAPKGDDSEFQRLSWAPWSDVKQHPHRTETWLPLRPSIMRKAKR